ncbi:MAG: DUF4185 domain-containing protein [Gammaproteobacteria bacterium]|nr:DUF4185 domain-containing protein [Gammaproteobacteria bacterium]
MQNLIRAVTFAAVCGVCTAAFAASPPYAPSPVVTSVNWDFSSLRSAAPGSDLWPVTWADDGNLYTSWGDGGGFGGTNSLGRVSIGFARITGTPSSLSATNVFGGVSALTSATFVGKAGGMLSVNGVLYMTLELQDQWLKLKLARSTDHGQTWQFNSLTSWDFDEPDGAFSDMSFLNFGKDYQGARDSYVYAYSQDKRATHDNVWRTNTIAMARVPKDQVMNRSAYEYFAGLDASGNPIWTTAINARKPVFSDPNGVGWAVRVDYDPGIKRYLLTTWHSWDGSWGIFDAPEPWGPWTTVAYYAQWIDNQPKFGFSFPQKWLSPDGRSFVMVFSGTGPYDGWNTVSGTFVVSAVPAASAPPIPTDVRLTTSP